MCVRITDFGAGFVEQIAAGAWPTFLCRDINTVGSGAALFLERQERTRTQRHARTHARPNVRISRFPEHVKAAMLKLKDGVLHYCLLQKIQERERERAQS